MKITAFCCHCLGERFNHGEVVCTSSHTMSTLSRTETCQLEFELCSLILFYMLITIMIAEAYSESKEMESTIQVQIQDDTLYFT